MKTRKWNVTINKNAQAWYEFRDVINNQSRCKYAYIVHDKDNEEQPHVHIILNYDNARSFENIQKIFVGAHIEPCKFYNQSMRYLVHLDDDTKYQYDFDEIITNYNVDEILLIINSDEFEKLDSETILIAIRDGKVHNITSAIKQWGLHQVKNHQRIIETLIQENRNQLAYDEEKYSLMSENRSLKNELQAYRELLESLRIERGFTYND